MMNANLPAVSVILPVYNGEQFLRRAIESVLAQEQTLVELIVVDGASTDGTGTIAASFGDRIRYFRTARDNQASAMNFGIGKARYPLIAFMASDDLWLPQKIERQVKWLTANPNGAITYCLLRCILHDGHQWPSNLPDRLRDEETPGLIPEAMLCRREVFDRVGLFDFTFKAFDVDWFARMCDSGESFGVVPQVLLLKGVHGSNTWLSTQGFHSDIMRALHKSIRRKSGNASPNL